MIHYLENENIISHIQNSIRNNLLDQYFDSINKDHIEKNHHYKVDVIETLEKKKNSNHKNYFIVRFLLGCW